jgi:plastocyanin
MGTLEPVSETPPNNKEFTLLSPLRSLSVIALTLSLVILSIACGGDPSTNTTAINTPAPQVTATEAPPSIRATVVPTAVPTVAPTVLQVEAQAEPDPTQEPTPTPEATPTPTSIPTPEATPTLTSIPTLTPLPISASIPNAASVTVKNIAFTPMSVTVEIGGTVTWDFTQGTHTTTGSGSESWDSEVKNSGSFSHKFDLLGSFSYICSLHPSMTGTVIVE